MEYKAGVCNIGPWNRFIRGIFGIAMLGLSFFLWWVMVRYGIPKLYRLSLIIPLYSGFVGIYQTLFGFCVYHAAKHTFDLR